MDAGWFADPTGRAELRWWDGANWTEHVSTGGQVSTAPLSAAEPPVQGVPQQPEGRGDAGISGELIDGSHAEVSGLGPTQQNSKMLRVGLGEPFLARQGSMVAYQGEVDFAYQGGGVGRFLKSAVTGEGIETLLAAIEAHVSGELTSFAVTLQPSQLRLADWIYRNSEVVSRKDEEDGSVALSLTMTESAREELEGRLRGM